MQANKIANIQPLISSSGALQFPCQNSAPSFPILALHGVKDIDWFFNDKFPLCYGS